MRGAPVFLHWLQVNRKASFCAQQNPPESEKITFKNSKSENSNIQQVSLKQKRAQFILRIRGGHPHFAKSAWRGLLDPYVSRLAVQANYRENDCVKHRAPERWRTPFFTRLCKFYRIRVVLIFFTSFVIFLRVFWFLKILL